MKKVKIKAKRRECVVGGTLFVSRLSNELVRLRGVSDGGFVFELAVSAAEIEKLVKALKEVQRG